MRPSLNKVKEPYSSLGSKDIDNIMRCDAPDAENVDNYQKLSKQNAENKKIVQSTLVEYIKSLKEKVSIVSDKAYLYSSSNANSMTKAYLIKGDLVGIIKYSSDRTLVNVGYVGSTNKPLVTWVNVGDVK